MSLNDISKQHKAWIDEVGWKNKNTVLESLALITSEIGEAVNECRGAEIDYEKFGDELADIILRTCGLAEQVGIDIEKACYRKMGKNQLKGTRGRIK